MVSQARHRPLSAPRPCARSARPCRPFCRVALSLLRFSALPSSLPLPAGLSQPRMAVVHQAGLSPRSPLGRLIARSHSARLSRPPGINFINAIDSATMTRFPKLSRAMTVNTGLNGIMACCPVTCRQLWVLLHHRSRQFLLGQSGHHCCSGFVDLGLVHSMGGFLCLGFLYSRCYLLLFLRVLTPGDQAFLQRGVM